MIFGKLLFGFILGNIASTLANAEIRRVKYEEKLDAIQVCNRLLVARREWQIRGQCYSAILCRIFRV